MLTSLSPEDYHDAARVFFLNYGYLPLDVQARLQSYGFIVDELEFAWDNEMIDIMENRNVC